MTIALEAVRRIEAEVASLLDAHPGMRLPSANDLERAETIEQARAIIGRIAETYPELRVQLLEAFNRQICGDDMASKKTDNESNLMVRCPPELLERLDAEVERQQARMPGMAISRSGVIRSMLHRGLDAAEAEAKRSKK